MLLRDYIPQDFPQLIKLWQELDMSSKERGDSPEIILQTIEHGGRLIIMEETETGVIIGSSWMTFDGRRIFLHHFGIKKQYQRRGLGLKLAIESLNYIKQMGYQVKLEVHNENIPAKNLYEKIGFTSFPNYDIYMIRNLNIIHTEIPD